MLRLFTISHFIQQCNNVAIISIISLQTNYIKNNIYLSIYLSICVREYVGATFFRIIFSELLIFIWRSLSIK